MKDKLFVVLYVFLMFLVFSNYAVAQPDTTFYKGKKIKQIVNGTTSADGLFFGEQKLYNKKGVLQEIITFRKANKKANKYNGVLKTYYNDTTIASEVPVAQFIKDKKRVIEIRSDKKVFGYHKNTTDISYEFQLKKPLTLRHKIYKKFNRHYHDFVLLHKTKKIKGLITTIYYFDDNKKIAGIDNFVNGVIDGVQKTYYTNRQLKSEGSTKRVRSTNYSVGRWVYYREDGVVMKDVEYYCDTIKANKPMRYGMLINNGKFYFPSAELQFLVAYPRAEDFHHRIDTIKAYYDNEKPWFKLDYDTKAKIKNGDSKKDYKHSAKYVEYYKSGKIKIEGFYVKIPRYKLTKSDLVVDSKLGSVDNRKVASWLYYDEAGNILKKIRYDMLTGKVKKITEGASVKKTPSDDLIDTEF